MDTEETQKTEDKSLEPCPFCEHSKPVVYLEEEPIPNGSSRFDFTFCYEVLVKCENCGSRGTVCLNKIKNNAIKDAIAAWNTRQSDTKPKMDKWQDIENLMLSTHGCILCENKGHDGCTYLEWNTEHLCYEDIDSNRYRDANLSQYFTRFLIIILPSPPELKEQK